MKPPSGPKKTNPNKPNFKQEGLHLFIAWSAAAFRNAPSDIVERTLSLASLAVQTVRRIGRQYFVVDRLIYSCGAERDTGTIEHGCAFGFTNG